MLKRIEPLKRKARDALINNSRGEYTDLLRGMRYAMYGFEQSPEYFDLVMDAMRNNAGCLRKYHPGELWYWGDAEWKKEYDNMQATCLKTVSTKKTTSTTTKTMPIAAKTTSTAAAKTVSAAAAKTTPTAAKTTSAATAKTTPTAAKTTSAAAAKTTPTAAKIALTAAKAIRIAAKSISTGKKVTIAEIDDFWGKPKIKPDQSWRANTKIFDLVKPFESDACIAHVDKSHKGYSDALRAMWNSVHPDESLPNNFTAVMDLIENSQGNDDCFRKYHPAEIIYWTDELWGKEFTDILDRCLGE